MPKASSIQPDKNISFLFKGDPGSSKTCAACSFAAIGDVWLAYFDKQTPVEIYNYFNKIGRPELLERIEFDSYSSVNANEYLNKLFKLSRDPGRYVAGITDSVTNLTSAAVNWNLKFRPGAGSDSSKDIALPDMDEYKTETSLVTQALDICKSLPWFNIWTAHPLNQIRIKAGAGGKMQEVVQGQTLVTYGSKVGSMIAGNFTEAYHFGRHLDERRVWTDALGDNWAKSAYTIPSYFDITNKLFYEVWVKLVSEAFPKEVLVDNPNDRFGPKILVPSPFAIALSKIEKNKQTT